MALNNRILGKTSSKSILVILVGIALVILGFWIIKQKDNSMRNALLRQTYLMSNVINTEDIKLLSGTESDLGTPNYLKIKEKLSGLRETNSDFRFVSTFHMNFLI